MNLAIPRVTKLLMMMNIIMYIISHLIPTDVLMNMLSYGIFSGNFNPIQLITSMFLHSDLSHLFMNMITLWITGRIVENLIGHKKFILLYIMSGIGGSLIQGIFFPHNPCLGASSAIFGILMSLIILCPNKEIKLFFIPFLNFKIKYLIGIIFIFELIDSIKMVSDGIGHWAHVGGGIVGMLMSSKYSNGYDRTKI